MQRALSPHRPLDHGQNRPGAFLENSVFPCPVSLPRQLTAIHPEPPQPGRVPPVLWPALRPAPSPPGHRQVRCSQLQSPGSHCPPLGHSNGQSSGPILPAPLASPTPGDRGNLKAWPVMSSPSKPCSPRRSVLSVTSPPASPPHPTSPRPPQPHCPLSCSSWLPPSIPGHVTAPRRPSSFPHMGWSPPPLTLGGYNPLHVCRPRMSVARGGHGWTVHGCPCSVLNAGRHAAGAR